ncbi:class I adenylate-forming enzyme family protein [Frankia sp. Cr2]|uniref:class I adenylate-forming enzyme family protein n=1 Tax=Frankia sp. Cr2 TaxID=3073932 RepID=UPI002AD22C2D|nr:class I adenylate-forming enzyme family protein [Frankia sp. Cr2]
MTTSIPAGIAAYWASDTSVPLVDSSVGDVLRRQCERTPDATALNFAGSHGLVTRTYRQLFDEATTGAMSLLTHVSPGERVAVWAPNSIDWVVLEYAAALAGVVLTPLNPALTPAEVTAMLGHSRVKLVFAVPEARGKPLLAQANEISTHVAGISAVLNLHARTPHDGWPPGPRPVSIELPVVEPIAPFLLQFTSGTTGRPKCAVLSHRAAFNVARMCALGIDDGPNQVYCTPLPLHHVAGTVSMVLGSLSVGGALTLLPAYDPLSLLDALESTRATMVGVVPTMAVDLLAEPSFRSRSLTLRTLLGGGSAISPALVRDIESTLGIEMLVGYGQSESPSITQTRRGDPAEVKATTIGRPLPNREVRIRRPESDETAAFDEIGELCTRSKLVMDGYWDDPSATAEAIDAAGWLRTGDLCSMDEGGLISFHGRIRDVLIVGGENVYPREIENVLLAHPAIFDAAVVGAPDRRLGERPAAFLRLNDSAVVTENELRDYVSERLATIKVPREWHFVAEFPLTAAGKVKKFELQRQLQDGAKL